MTQTRRLTTASLGLVAALSFGLGGCGTSDDKSGAAAPTAGGSPTVSATAESAVDALTAAAEKLNDDTVKVSMTTTGVTSEAQMDPKANKAAVTMTVAAQGRSTNINIVVLDKDVYMKVPGLPNIGNKWMHVDAAKLAGSSFDIMPQGDPSGANNLIKGVVDVQRDGDNSFKGTLDLTKSPTANKASVQVLGEKAKAVPFTATTDAEGRLTGLTVDMSVLDPSLEPLKTTYSGFGSPVTVEQPPASQVVEAPDSVLKTLGG
jgi:hypothetical protein